MRLFTTLLPTFALAGLLVACSGEEMGEAPPSEMDVASGDALDCYLAGATLEEARERVSPHSRTSFSFSGGEGLLCYGSPSARGREIMGGLVPFGAPWRIGADEPTTIHLSAPATVGGVSLQPGSYSLYAVPSEGDWEFFINTNWQRWGIPISDEVRGSEVGSFTATPEATDSMVEALTYTWQNGEIVMEWENTRLRIPVSGS